MDETPSSSASQLSVNEKTPDSDSGTSTLFRAHTKSSKSPTLQAFHSFEEALAQFNNHVLTKYDHVGHADAIEMKAMLGALDTKCESLKIDFAEFISSLADAIQEYEKKKPTDLAVDANSAMPPDKPARNRASLFKKDQSIEELFEVLNRGVVHLQAAIGKKILTSIYDDYSFSMDKKLKKLKAMCEYVNNELERIGKRIKKADERNKSNEE